MLGVLIQTQWTRVRVAMVLTTLAALAVPVIMVLQGGAPSDGYAVGYWLRQSEAIGTALPVVALFSGLYLGIAAWADDVRGRHVYAMTLPVSRERYVLMRFTAGLLPLLAPVAGLLIGSLIATALVNLPAGLNAYPVALTIRVALAGLTTYAVFFALASATKRAAAIVVGLIATLIIAELVMALLSINIGLIPALLETLTEWPAPFAILTGRWALFDV